MPRREDIHTILILGSGPIVIGQGCEFDYSGTQACKALAEEGYRVILVNSNPATIMTDPAFSDRTYIEPITAEAVEKIIEKEAASGAPIDAVLPTLGGQTGLNCACELFDRGVLQKHCIEMIGASRDVIHRAEDREAFRNVIESIGLDQPESEDLWPRLIRQAVAFLERDGDCPRSFGRRSRWAGGAVGSRTTAMSSMSWSDSGASTPRMISQVQVDRSLIGWKEYELEVVRDRNDNCVIVCGIENIDRDGRAHGGLDHGGADP